VWEREKKKEKEREEREERERKGGVSHDRVYMQLNFLDKNLILFLYFTNKKSCNFGSYHN